MSIAEYQQAYREFRMANEAAVKMINDVSKISDAMRYELRSFIGYNLGIDIQPQAGGRYNPKGNAELSTLPSSEQVQATFRAWIDSYNHLADRWRNIPEGEREGLAAPPGRLHLTGY